MKNPIPWLKKVVREFDRGTRGRFLHKAVPRHGVGGYLIMITVESGIHKNGASLASVKGNSGGGGGPIIQGEDKAVYQAEKEVHRAVL